ncbi:MAG: PhoH family protein [Planctomycetes bacterium]|nr:PhoH family protein [Planctomycetota bacterium]
MIKTFVLDTNVLLHNANSLRSFGKSQVVIPIDVIEELDKFKKESTDLGRNAREVIRFLDRLRRRGRLGEGVVVDEATGGTVAVDLHTAPPADAGLDLNTPDNRILAVALRLARDGKEVVFVSKDMNQRIKADALDIRAMDFEKQTVNIDELYLGWRELQAAPDEVRDFYEKKRLHVEERLYPHEFVLLRDRTDPKHTALGRSAGAEGHEVMPFRGDISKIAGISPRNMEQRCALEILLDDDVRLVTLVGQAGTGKTLLALAAGYQRTVKDGLYEKLLVSRPIMPLGRDLGYLPGTKEEKLTHWMQPIFDNLKFLLRSQKGTGDGGRKVEDLLAGGLVEMEALTYIRGRSIFNQFLIVDEAQNLTPHEVKTIISRAGHDTKLVLTGDPYQIDNPYLDSNSNGLCYVVERMKGSDLFGHVQLSKSERSRLASVAVELL